MATNLPKSIAPSLVFKPKTPTKPTIEQTISPNQQSNLNNVTPPARRGGGGGGGGGSSKIEVTPQDVKQIERTAESAQAQNIITQIDQAKKTNELLKINQQSSIRNAINNDLVQSEYNRNQGLTRSTAYPSAQVVGQAQKQGLVTPQQAGLTYGTMIKDTATKYAEQRQQEIMNDAKARLNDFAQKEQERLNQRVMELQERANQGENVNKLNDQLKYEQQYAQKRIDNEKNKLIKESKDNLTKDLDQWQRTVGAGLSERAGISVRSADRLNRLSVKNISKQVGKGFTEGFAGGFTITAGLQALKIGGKATLGAGLTAVGSAFSLGSGLFTANKEVKEGKIQKSEFWAEAGTLAVERGSRFLGGTAGAYAGSYAYMGLSNYIQTGNIKGIKVEEQKLANQALEKNGFKAVSVKGQVTESKIAKLSMSEDGKNVLKQELSSGNTIRKVTYKPDTTGLNKAEIQALGKYGLKVESYAVVDQNGNILRTIEVTRIYGKAPITKIVDGQTEILASTKGFVKDGKFIGERVSIEQRGLSLREQANKFTVEGQKNPPNRITSVFKETVVAKGNVKIKENLRLEDVKGFSRVTEKYNIENVNGQQKISQDMRSLFSAGSQKVLSKQIAKGEGIISGGDKAIGVKSTFFEDVAIKGNVRGGQENFLDISRIPPSKGFRSLPELPKSPVNTPTNTGNNDLVIVSAKGEQGSMSSLGIKSDSFLLPQSPAIKEAGLTIIKNTPTTVNSPVANLKIDLIEPKIDSGFMKSVLETDERIFKVPSSPDMKLGNILLPTQNNNPTVNTRANVRSNQIIDVAPIQNNKQEPLLQMPTLLKNPNPKINPTKPIFPELGLPGIPPFKGRVEVGGGGFTPKTKGGLWGKTAYTPSLGSLITGSKKKVTLNQLEKMGKQTYTGLGLRPMVILSEARKKKKKK